MKKLLLLSMTAISAVSFAGDWIEVGDAAAGVPAHQATDGTGSLDGIRGNLMRSAGDHVDTYCFTITSQTQFLASTKISFGGSALVGASNADTRLWLWDMGGNALLGNDDVNTASLGSDTLASFISDPTTFSAFTGGELVNASATGVVLNPGTYLLSIALFPVDPDDAGGVDQVNLGSDFDALHGKNVASGAFSAWETSTATSDVAYRIGMRGATYCVPEPASMIALGLGAAAMIRRRSKKA